MQWIWLQPISSLAITVLSSALPDEYLRTHKVPSLDNTCGITAAGNFVGHSCDPHGGNPCCGPEGRCGISSDFCGPGCQQDYGACTVLGSTNKCGQQYGRCISGTCCSALGYCGTTREACGFECNLNWGDCWGQDPLLPTDNPYDTFLNGKIDVVRSGIATAVTQPNTGLKTALRMELLPVDSLTAVNDNFLGIVDVVRHSDEWIG